MIQSDTQAANKPSLNVLLAGPRGFCAGVDRAIKIVEEALKRYGAPVYVRHEIVHNRFVVESLERQGAIFVEELHEIPDNGQPVVFSAHGVPKAIPGEAERREMFYLDATGPLVSKVHREAEHHHARGRHILLIGHAGHPEVIGTMGQLPEGAVTLIEDIEDAAAWEPKDASNVAFLTQTTLSVDDTADMIALLRERFPGIAAPHKEDICYATTNRQDAVRRLAEKAELVLVVGSKNSSNSVRLKEVGLKAGAREAHLIDDASGIDWAWFEGVSRVGLTAGASASEDLVQGVIDAIAARFDATVEELVEARETITFKLPRLLTA